MPQNSPEVLTRGYCALHDVQPQGDSLVACIDCGNVQRWAEMCGWNCNSCFHGEEERSCGDCDSSPCECDENFFEERAYSTDDLPQFQSTKPGKYIKSKRIFSAEIECYYPNGKALRALSEIPRAVGMSGDGSLNSQGIELQTPKLQGANGEALIMSICKTLQGADFTVDKTTGLHIHLDGKGLLPRSRTATEPLALKQLWAFYHLFDKVMLSFLPQSRRDNRFCHPVTQSANMLYIVNAKNLTQLEEAWYKDSRPWQIKSRKAHKYDNSRYCGLNLHSLFASRHVEIRFHGGTLNPTKILEWANLHQTILDLASAKKLDIRTASEAEGLSLRGQTQLFFNMLGLSEKSRRYFLRRQELFTASTESEDVSDTALLAESVGVN